MDSGLPPEYGWAPPNAPLPMGWHQDATTGQILPPGAAPAGSPPPGLLPGYGWIAPGTELPAGWSVDPATDVLVGPASPANGMPPGPVQPSAAVHPVQPGPGHPAATDTGGWEAAARPGGSAFAHHGDPVGAGLRE